ncbi:MAG: SLC13/DASS family transporter [Nitrospirae bacterium]|nr:SLC13/DASS family transporter [Nitrospirota bacterium]
MGFIVLGLVLFTALYSAPPFNDAVDPYGRHFVLSHEGKGALAVFLLALAWWIFDVFPIGVTGIIVGVMQALFSIRPVRKIFNDFMDPSVMFIFASIAIGMVFAKTGLTRRMAYKVLSIIGERTGMVYIGTFLITVLMSHFMAYTTVAATMFPLLLMINTMYADDRKPTRFGKGLFIGMAYVAGVGSTVTLLGAARAVVAIGFYKEIVGMDITFFGFTKHTVVVAWVMVFLLIGFFLLFFRPEKKTIPGLREKAKKLYAQLGPFSGREIGGALIVAALALSAIIPSFEHLDKTAVILVSTLMFFIFKVLDIKDLEEIPWNTILLYGGAMSIGFCLWETGAVKWLAIHCLSAFKNAHWFIFVIGITFFVLMTVNLVMNTAVITIVLPVALVISPYLGISPEVVFYCTILAAGMPFLLLAGAAPNAIAFESKQFTLGEFFVAGIPASIMFLIVISIAIWVIWPMLGMPVTLPVR